MRSQPADGLLCVAGEPDLTGLEQHGEGWQVELQTKFDTLD